jgi:hypothetical protein
VKEEGDFLEPCCEAGTLGYGTKVDAPGGCCARLVLGVLEFGFREFPGFAANNKFAGYAFVL